MLPITACNGAGHDAPTHAPGTSQGSRRRRPWTREPAGESEVGAGEPSGEELRRRQPREHHPEPGVGHGGHKRRCFAIEKASVDLAAHERTERKHREQERQVRSGSRGSENRAAQPMRGRSPPGASRHARSPWRASGRSGRETSPPSIDAAVDAHAGPARLAIEQQRSRLRQELLLRGLPRRRGIRSRGPAASATACVHGSGSPAATRSCACTRSTPVTASVTGCSTCSRVFISRK